jgi:hypothetical protein
MKNRILMIVLVAFGMSLLFCYPGLDHQAQARGNAGEEKITVLSPRGQPPLIQLKSMAPRLDTLEGKTVYLVNDGYLGTDILLGEMQAWFEVNVPKLTTVYKRKGGGGFTAEDPDLWAEIKEKADAVIMGMGH